MSDVGYGSRAVIRDKEHNIGGAIHKVEAGKRTDMLFHTRLTKVLYLLAGDATIRVIKDGQVKGMKFEAGTSLSIPPGFMHQIEAKTDTIIVEFINDPSTAYNTEEGGDNDTHVISKGTNDIVALPEEKTQPAIVMSEEDKAATKKTTKKKTTKKKSTRKKKTSKRTN